jgi:phosphopantetheinyl transferase
VTDGPACPSLRWRTRSIGDEPTVEDWASLSESDVARAASLTHPAAMTRFVATRALLRATVVQHRPELARAVVVFDVTATGRLEVAGHPDLAVSSSHTVGSSRRGSFAAAAVADDGPVGIDVEPLDRRGQLPRPAAWLTPPELDDLAQLDGRAAHERGLHRLMLLHLWVAKEAALKAWPGPGSTSRRRIRISCHGRAPEAPTAQLRVPASRDASWCGAGVAVVDPTGPVGPVGPSPDPCRRARAPDPAPSRLRLEIHWYAIDDAYLVALAHGHTTDPT